MRLPGGWLGYLQTLRMVWNSGMQVNWTFKLLIYRLPCHNYLTIYFFQWDRSMSFYLWKSWCFTGGDQLFLSKGLLSLFCRFSCFFSVKQCRLIICNLLLTICKYLIRLLVNFWIIIVVLQQKKEKRKDTYMVLKMIKERTWDFSDVVLFMLNISLSLSL